MFWYTSRAYIQGTDRQDTDRASTDRVQILSKNGCNIEHPTALILKIVRLSIVCATDELPHELDVYTVNRTNSTPVYSEYREMNLQN